MLCMRRYTSLPKVFNVIFKFFQLQHVTHRVAVQECLSAGPPVDVCVKNYKLNLALLAINPSSLSPSPPLSPPLPPSLPPLPDTVLHIRSLLAYQV